MRSIQKLSQEEKELRLLIDNLKNTLTDIPYDADIDDEDDVGSEDDVKTEDKYGKSNET